MRTLALLLAFLVYYTPIARSADIKRLEYSECVISLDGEITDGDAERFRISASGLKLLDGTPGDYVFNEINEAICLNSPGGSWAEAREIAQSISDFGVTTRIMAGDECLSACSLVFMAGRFRGAEFDGPSRYLDVRGRLGFHGPYLVPPEGRSYSASEVHAVSVMQNEIISDFIKFGSSGYEFSNRGFISVSLIGEMLAHGPEEMLYADTVERIARWNIYLEGTKDGIQLNKKRLFQACENVLNFPFDRPARTIVEEIYEGEPDVEISHLPSHYSGGAKVFGQVQFSGEANRVCQIQLNNDGGQAIDLYVNGISICAQNGNSGISTGECPDFPSYFPYYYALSPNTSIVSLAK